MRNVFSDQEYWACKHKSEQLLHRLIDLKHKVTMKREERREKEGMRRELLCSVEWAEGFYSVIKKFGNYLLIMGLVSVGTFLNIQVF